MAADANEVNDLRQRIEQLYKADIVKEGQQRRCIGNIYWGSGRWMRYGEGNKERRKLDHAEDRAKWLEDSCALLFDAAYLALETNANYFQQLDCAFSELLVFEWRPQHTKCEVITEYTCQLLVRLPRKSTPLQDNLNELPDACFTDGTHTWETLQTVSQFSSNMIRLVIWKAYALYEGPGRTGMDAIINSSGQLIAVCVEKAKISASLVERNAWRLTRAFLWTFWQQFRTFHQADIVSAAALDGFSLKSDNNLWFREFLISEGMTLSQYTKLISVLNKPSNLCSWAFELVRSNSSCLGLGFDLLHERWESVLGSTHTRCSSSCDGIHPDHCIRYKGLEVKSQSMHDRSCSGVIPETKLAWDRDSYRSVRGPRAVSIETTNLTAGPLQYCAATENTLAISHVWSHGQGGRPHEGINQCLHQRYVEVAREQGCDSYWMDVTCIPNDHDLRSEAISQINGVFRRSKGVLVCDIDLMTIDISEMTTEKHEAILCALVLCDWNLRAWTLMEGLKGRANILVLCKDNKTLSLSQTMRHVVQHGSLSILSFAYLLIHILPGSVLKDYGPDKEDRPLAANVVGAWLSHRPASRPGDDVVIWSLLQSESAQPVYKAHDFWRNQQRIYSGYLLSSAERLKDKGFSWAPKTPYAVPQIRKDGSIPIPHFPTVSAGTETLRIDDQGLTGSWWVFQFEAGFPFLDWDVRKSKEQSPIGAELRKVKRKFINSVFAKYGALLKPFAFEDQRDLDFGGARETLLAVCETSSRVVRSDPVVPKLKSYQWTWKGVYAWPAEVPLPEFEQKWWFWIS